MYYMDSTKKVANQEILPVLCSDLIFFHTLTVKITITIIHKQICQEERMFSAPQC